MASEPIMWSEIERSPQFSEATPEQKLQSLDEWTKGALSLTEDQQQRELFEAFADREKRKLLGEEVPDVKVKDYLPIYRERKRQEAVDQQGLLSQLGGALATGTEEVLTGLKGTAAAYTGDTKALAESLAQTTAIQQEKQLAKTTEDIAFEKELEQNAKEFEQAKGFWPTAKELLDYATITAKNPSAALKMGLSSAPNAIVSFGGQILGRAAGAATGAVLAGAPTLGAGAIPGAVAGLFGGGMVTNAVLETQPQIYESLIKATEGKAEQMDANQIQKLIEKKPEIVSEGLKKGATRGAVIGAVESLFTKGASRLLSVTERAQAKAVSQLAKNEGFETAEELLKKSITDDALKDKIVDVAARAAIPLSKAEKAARSIGAGALGVVGEGAGEAAAMAATGEKLDPTAIYQEMLGAGVMAGGEVAVLRGLEKSASVLQKLDKAQSLIDQSAPVAPSAASAAQAVANEAATASAASIVASAPAPADRAAEIQSRLAEIEKEFGPRQKATLAADGTPSFQDARVNTTEEDALLKELSALNQAPAVAPTVSAVAPATAAAAVSAGVPASAPAESVPSKPTVSIASSPSPNLVPRATENAPPRPVRQTGESREQFVARLDEWDANYAKTHNADGTPYQPTVLDETVGKALAALKGKSFDDRIDAIGSDINLEMGSYLAQLLNDGWVWDDATGRMVDPQNRGETPIEALARIKRKAATPVEAVTPDPFSTTPQPQTTPTDASQIQVQEAGRVPPVESQPVVQPPAVQAQEGAPQRQGEGQEEVTQTALKAVTTNTATPGQVASLQQQGLARVVRGQPVITEAGIAKMPEQDRPALTEAQRVAEIEAAPETAQGASPAETNGQAQDQQTAATEQLLGSVDQTEEGAQEEEPPTQEQIAKGLAYVESMIAGIKGVVIYDRLESLLARTDLSEDEKNALREARTQAIYSNGRAIIATDKVRKGTQYTSLDKAIAAVVFHELMHYGSDVLRNSQDMAPMYNSWVNMLKENVTDAMIDGLVTNAGYVGFADWATNPESKLRAMEEIFVRQLTDLYNRKGSLSLQEESLLQRFMNWIKNVVNTAIGTDFKIGIDDKILNDWGRKFIRAVSSSVNVANANSNAAIMRSLVGAGLITPAMDAEYLAAVEAGDMEKAQRMVDEAAEAAGAIHPITSTIATTSDNDTGAYHYGDAGIGRDTVLSRMSAGRSTGHFGTGTYFLGKKEGGSREGKPIKYLDLTGLNLAKTNTPIILHDGLRLVNKMVLRLERPEYTEPRYDGTKAVSAIWTSLGAIKSEAEVRDAIDKTYQIFETGKNDGVRTPSTYVMQFLGYDGVDARGTEADNGDYGSVVYPPLTDGYWHHGKDASNMTVVDLAKSGQQTNDGGGAFWVSSNKMTAKTYQTYGVPKIPQDKLVQPKLVLKELEETGESTNASKNYQFKRYETGIIARKLNGTDKERQWSIVSEDMQDTSVKVATWLSQNGYYPVSEDKTLLKLFIFYKNPLVVNGGGKLKLESWRSLTDKAKSDGNDAVVVINTIDTRGTLTRDSGQKYIGTTVGVFSPSQIKSADPVTYDDAGNVIPLSQRFQQSSPDIRRSIGEAIPFEKQSGTTQVATTTGSYVKAANVIKSLIGSDSTVLDYGAGLGLGTDALRSILPNTDSLEPNTERWKGISKPTYTNSSQIQKKYGAIVNMNVLNVVPKSIRDSIVDNIADTLEEGGVAVIGVRKWSDDVNRAKGTPGAEPKSILIQKKEGETFQKGFDGDELIDYISERVGEGFLVVKSGIAANGAIIKKLSKQEMAQASDPATREKMLKDLKQASSQAIRQASPDIRRSIDTILGETPTPRMANDLLSTFDEEERKAFDEFIKNNPKAGFDKLSQFLGLEQGGELGRVEKLAPLIDRARNFLGFKVNKNNNPIVNKEATEKAYQAAIDLIRPNSTFGKDYQLRNGGTESAATAVLQMELAKYALALARKGDQRLLSILRKNWNGIMLGAYITATSAGRILNVRSKYVSEVLRTIDTMSKEINKSAIQQLEKLGLTKEGAASVLDRLNKAVKDAQADEKTRQEFIDALEKKLKAAPVSGGTELDWIDYGLRGVDSEYLAKFRGLMESIKKAGLIRKRREEILAAKNGIENSFFDEILGGVPEDFPTDIDALDSMLLEEESKIKDALDSLTSMETNKRRSKKKKKPATPTTPGEAVSDTAATDVAEAEDDSEADKAAQKVLEELKDFLNREYGKEAPEQTVYDVIKERVKIAISNPDGNPANVFRKDLEQALSGFDIKPELLEDLVATSYTTYARYVQKDAERIAEKLVAEKVEGGSLLPNEVQQLRDVVKQAIANKDKLTKDAFDAKYLPLLSGLGVEDGTAITIVDAAFAKNQEAAAKSEENRKARLQEDAKALTDSLLGKAPKKVPAAKVETFRTVVRDFLSNPSNLDEAKFINQLSTKLQTFGLNQPESTELARAAFKKSVEIKQDNLRKAEESFDKGVQGILDNLTGSAVSKASTAPTILGQIRKIIGDAVKNVDNLDQAAFEAKYSAELAPLVNDANRVKELVKAAFDKFSQLQSKKEEDRAKAFTKDIQGIIDTLTGSALPKKKAPPTVIGQIKKIIGEAVRNKDSLDQAAFETKYTALFEPLVGDKTRAQELAKAAYAGSVSYKQSAISKRADRAKSALLGGYRSRMVANIQAKATPEQMADFAWRTEQMMNLLSSMGYTEQESVDILSKFSYDEIEQVLTNNINPNLAQDVQSRQAAYAKLFANRYEKELDAGKNKDDSRIRMANLRGLMKSQVKVNLPKDVFLMEAMKFGASAETAEKLYNLTERERNEIASDDTKKLPTKFGKLIDYILKNPSLMNDDASRDAAIEGFLRDNGFDESQISSLLPWILPMASDYINMAKAKAMQAELDSLDARRNKSEKLKAEKNKRVKDINEMSDEAYRKLKKTLETIRKGIAFVEGDVKDPSIKKVSDVASALAKENGFSGFLPSDYQALAELDLKITSAMADGRPHDSAEGLRELYELLSRRSAPRSLLEFVSIVYNNNALGGLSTLYINIIAPFGEFITKVIIDAGRALLNRDFNQAFISIRAMIDSFKKAVKEGAFGLEGGASVVAMSQQVQKVTTLQGDVVAAQKVWNDKKASKLQKLAAGYTMVSAKTDIIRRVLSTTDHVAFTAFQNYLIKTRANDLLTKHLGMKPEEALPFLFSLSNRSTELIKAETGVINNTIQKLSDVGFDYEKSLQILEEVRNDPSITEPDLVQFTQDLVGGFRRMVEAFQTPEKIKRNLVREARRQKNIVYLRANDRNNKDMLDFLRGEFIKGGKAELVDETIKNFNNFVQKESEYVMGVHGGEQAPGLDVINLFSNQIVKAGEAVIRSNPLVGRMLLGYFKIPVNLLNRAFWFTPYGLIRLGINKWGNKAGEYYQQSMNTQAQIRQRFTEAIVGTSAMVALFILQGMADDDEEFVVTLAGPTNKTEKDAYRKMGYRDGSIALKTGGKVYSLNWARGPLESFKIALMLVGAVNDMKLNRKLGEKKGFDISEYLSAVMYGWSRQASFFGAKSTIGATLAIQPDASLIGQGLYKLNPLVPFSGLINSVEKIIAGPDLYRSGMGAVYANIPIARSLLTERAVNALGDPQGLNLNDKWSILNDRAWYSGIPLMISGTPTGRDKVIYDFILDRATGPGLPQRTQIENTNGPLNDSKWLDFVAFRGSLIKNAMFRDIGRLRRLDDDSLSTALTKISSEATKKAKRQFRFK